MKILIIYKYINDAFFDDDLDEESMREIFSRRKLSSVGANGVVCATAPSGGRVSDIVKEDEWDLVLFHTNCINYSEAGMTDQLTEIVSSQLGEVGLSSSEKVIPFSLGYSPWGQKLVKLAIDYGRGCKSEHKARKKIKKIRKKYNLYLSS